MHQLDVDDLRRRYEAGESCQAIGNSLGIKGETVKRRLQKAGVSIRSMAESIRLANAITLDMDDVIRRYRAGESAKAIADSLATKHGTILKRLQQAGVETRDRKRASRVRYSRMTPEQRLRVAESAHAAVRGVPHSEEQRVKMAMTRQARQSCIGPKERELADRLAARGVAVIPQMAVGRYNVDVAIPETRIAVEVFGGHWHASGQHAARHRQRLDYILDRGWTPLIIWVTNRFPLGPGAIDYVIALHEVCRADESVRGQEHMIRGDGYGGTVFKAKPDGRPVVPSYNGGPDAAGLDRRTG